MKEQRRYLEGLEARRQRMKKLVSQCLGLLMSWKFVDHSAIGDWDVKYYADLEEERGFRASTQVIEGIPTIAVGLKLREDRLEDTIAHETVHLAQYFRGDVERVGPGLVKWKGEIYTLIPPEDPKYDFQPWEAEAYILGARLVAALSGGRVTP